MLGPSGAVIPVTTTVFFILVISTRFLYGDWATAWTAAGSLAALTAVLLAWTQMAINR